MSTEISPAALLKKLLFLPIVAGAHDLKFEGKRSVMTLNILALALIFMVSSVGAYFYHLRPSMFFIIGVPVECLCFFAVIVLNWRKAYFSANLLMLVTNAVFIAYWSLILGAGINIDLLLCFITVIIFHMGSSFLLHKRGISLVIGILATAGIGAFLLANSVNHYIQPIQIRPEITVVMHWLTSMVLLFLMLIVLMSYAIQIHDLLKETKKHKDASEQKSKFLTDVFHEMRAPLNVIYSISQLFELRKNKYTKSEQTEISQLYSSCDMSHDIINRVLDHERIESGMFNELKKETLRLKDTVSRCIVAQSYLAASRGINIELSFDADLTPPVFCDKIILTKILNNLLSNAVKFAKGNSKIQVSCQKLGNQIVFDVTNSGFIDPSVSSRLFERFVTKREQRAGSGLGLAIVKHLVELCGGRIGLLESQEHQTVTIRFHLPYEAGKIQDIKQEKNEMLKDCYRGARVLIVEDDPLPAKYLTLYLREMGVEATVCHEPAQFPKLLREKRPHLVISDLNMPLMNGDELVFYLKSEPDFKGIPIVIVSGNAFEKEKMLLKGADGFITKPVALNELYQELGKYLPYHVY